MKGKKKKGMESFFRRNDILSTTNLLLFGILIVGAFLRLFRIEENIYFSGEIGHNLLVIKEAFEHGTIPLIGPPTSHEWLFFGPLFYWLYGPILILSKFNPVSHAYFGAIVGWLILSLNYFVIKKIFTTRIALISTFLIAISPLFLEFAYFARFFSIVPLLVYPFIYFLYRILHGEKKFIFWLAFVYGCMFSFHFTPLMLLPFVITLFVIKKVRFQAKELVIAFVGFVIPMSPFLIYDIQHGMQMTMKIILWIPYRVAGFFGFFPKNTVSVQIIHENTSSIASFFEKSFFPPNFAPLVLVMLLTGVLFLLWHHHEISLKKIKLSDPILLVLLWFGWGFLAIFIHGSPPIHYFLPVLPLPILFFSLFIDSLWDKRFGMYIALFLLFVISYFSFSYYFSSQWFYRSQGIGDWSVRDVPYTLQKQVANVIINDAQGKDFVLKRVGLNDQFEGDYAQNYVYLLWLLGNEPVQTADMTYVIVEQPERIGRSYAGATKFLRAGNIVIIKIPTALLPKEERLTMKFYD